MFALPRRLLIASLCFFSSGHVLAQESGWTCGTEETEIPLAEGQGLPAPSNFLPVPVVFHVIHDGTYGNVSDAELEAEIDKLNWEFSASNMSFYTLGVSRIYNEYWYNNFGDEVQYALHADTRKYLNFYIVSFLYNGSGGASSLPPASGTPTDGFWVGHELISDQYTPNDEREDISTHETGHYMGLYHTWGRSDHGFHNGCSEDDEVADTPVHKAPNHSNNCDPQDSCEDLSGLDPIDNFMNYGSSLCSDRFSQGQMERMIRMRTHYRPLLGTSQPTIIDARSESLTYVDHTFTDDYIYILNGAEVEFLGNLTLDAGSKLVVTGGADFSGVTNFHLRRGSHLELRRHEHSITPDQITLSGGSAFHIGSQYTDYISQQQIMSVSDSVIVRESSSLDIGSGILFAGSSSLSVSGDSQVSVAAWDSSAIIAGNVSLTDGAFMTSGSSGSLVVSGDVSVLSGSSLFLWGEVTANGGVAVSGADSRLDLFGRLLISDGQSLRISNQGAWNNGLGTVLETGLSVQVIVEADAGSVTLPAVEVPTTFRLGEDSDLLFYNDGLTLVGSADGPLQIQPRDPALPWGSVYLYADDATLDHVHIEGAAEAGLTISAQNVTVQNTTVTGSGAGLHVMTDWEGGQSTVSVDNALLSGNEYGLVARDAVVGLTHSTIENSALHSLFLLPHARLDPFSATVIEGSGSAGSSHGVLIHDDATLWTSALDSGPGARNRITSSSGDAVRVLAGGFAWLGDQYAQDTPAVDLQGHENTLLRGPTPSTFAVNNLGGTPVPARGNYWGAPPTPDLFNGPVVFDHALTADLTGDSGYEPPVGGGCCGGRSAPSQPSPSMAVLAAGGPSAKPSSSATPSTWLQAWMAALRNRLLSPIATATTEQDARALAALTARDAEDVLGEGLLNRLALAAWAARLPLATGLEYDAAARAARGLVEAAVASEDYPEALGLAALYDTQLSEDEHRLALGVARATAYDGLGRREESAALVDSLLVTFGATLRPEEVEGLRAFRDDLDVLMAAGPAGTAASAPTASASAGGEAETPSPPLAITALVPNPTSGALRLGLAAPEPIDVRIEVFDVLGRSVLTASEVTVEPGQAWLDLTASALPSGVYVLRASALPGGGPPAVASRKFTVVR